MVPSSSLRYLASPRFLLPSAIFRLQPGPSFPTRSRTEPLVPDRQSSVRDGYLKAFQPTDRLDNELSPFLHELLERASL
jgi:hypothetical protein